MRDPTMAASNKYLSLLPSTGGFLSLTGQARTAILEMDISLLNAEDGMDKLVEKLDTLFLEDKNQSAFICYENFENYHRECNTSINDYLIQFDRHVAKLREFQITLPEPVLAYPCSEICQPQYRKWEVNQGNNKQPHSLWYGPTIKENHAWEFKPR